MYSKQPPSACLQYNPIHVTPLPKSHHEDQKKNYIEGAPCLIRRVKLRASFRFFPDGAVACRPHTPLPVNVFAALDHVVTSQPPGCLQRDLHLGL